MRIDLEAREVDWEFVPGQQTRAWAFGAQVPGPTIEAQVGDVLEIRLINNLPEPTVVHWHGLRIPAAMEGTGMVQRPAAPGETFTYRFRVPDAGTFWYHSHYNETVQLERGLYGALIVRASDEPVFDADRTFVLDDVELAKDGQIKPPGWWIESHVGSEGNTRLVNGRHKTPLLAFGVYSQERLSGAHFLDIGAQGYYEKGFLNFLAGPYYVKLSAVNTGPEDQEVLVAFAKRVAENLGPKGSLPAILSFFPTEGKKVNSEMFISKNFLGYTFLHDGFTADFELQGKKFKLFVIESENRDECKTMIQKYLQTIKCATEEITEGRYTLSDPHHGEIGLQWQGSLAAEMSWEMRPTSVLSPVAMTMPIPCP